MKSDFQNWLWEKWAEGCVKNLIKNEFNARFVPDIPTAADMIMELLAPFESFGFGGSCLCLKTSPALACSS